MSAEFWVGPHASPDRIRLGPAAASGAEGVLYRGFTEVDGIATQIAVKMLQPGHLDQLQAWTERWRAQAELLQQVEVPGLVRVRGGFVGPLPHSAGNADPSTSSLYLVMDWVEGVSLDRWVRTLDSPDPEELLLALVPVAVALDLLHSGAATGGLVVLHRDVKPANILVRPGGDTVLVDVGSVRGLVDEGRRSGVVGTAGYIAPEVAFDAQYGPAADRYALGAVAFFLLTSQEPPVHATSDDLGRLLLAAPLLEGRGDVARHVVAMLNADPEQRPTPLANWVAQLRRSSLVVLPADVALAPRAPGRNPARAPSRPAVTSMPAGKRRPIRGRRRSPGKRRAAAAGLVALILVGGSLFARAQRNVHSNRPSLVSPAQAEPTVMGGLDATASTAAPTDAPTLPSTIGQQPPPTDVATRPAIATQATAPQVFTTTPAPTVDTSPPAPQTTVRGPATTKPPPFTFPTVPAPTTTTKP